MKKPKKSGVFWVSFDDGLRMVIGPTLVRVRVEDGEFEGFALDGSFSFMPSKAGPGIHRVTRPVGLGGFRTGSTSDEMRAHWLAEVKPPRGALPEGADLPEGMVTT